jgi:outer membrane receptor for ferrienterochelin and colicin
VTPEWDVFVNAGYVSKVPIFDQVINDQNGTKIDDPKNEKILSFEGGINGNLMNKMLNVKLNYYYTNWKDRGESRGVRNADGSDGLVYLSGVASIHTGAEFEAAFQPVRFARLDAAASYAYWYYSDDVSGSYVSDFSTGASTNFNFYLKNLKVGDAPQVQLAVAGTIFPIQGMTAQIIWKYNAKHYASFDPFSRTQAYFAGEQSWETPAYSLFDLHFSYDIPVNVIGFDVTLFAHVFNLFDEIYVQDAVDNSQYNGYYANNPDRNADGKLNNADGMHTADDAEVFLGLPRSFNFGFTVRL